MAKIVMQEQEEILTFPADSILELKIANTEIVTVQGRREDWQKCKFEFKILGIQALGDGSRDFTPYDNWLTKSIWGSVGWRLTDSPENKLRIWAEAIFRQPLGLGFELDDEMFHNRKVRGITSQYDGSAKDARGVPFKRHQIETLLPFGEVAAEAAAPAVTAGPANDPWTTGGGAAAPAAPLAQGGAPAAVDPWGDSWGDEPPF